MEEYGYKWVSNQLRDVFIVRLKLYNCYDHIYKFEYYTTDCVVDKIIRLRDKKVFPRVLNGAYYRQDYITGERIKDTSIFFCKTIDELFVREKKAIQFEMNENGAIRYAINCLKNQKLSNEQKNMVYNKLLHMIRKKQLYMPTKKIERQSEIKKRYDFDENTFEQ